MRNKRRHSIGFGYIGSGNRINTFNTKPRKAFSDVKEKLNSESKKKHQLEFLNNNLSDFERQSIKNKIIKYERNKSISIIITSAVLFVLIMLAIIYLIENRF